MPDADFESRIHDFEQSWQRDRPGEIADFLLRTPALPSLKRHELLVELICIDLEFRWRQFSRDPVSHGRRLLESYAAEFPEIGSLDRMPIELIGEEYRVRQVWGDRPEHAEFFSRFPAQQEQLRTELPRIDREIDEELAGSCSSGIASPATGACAIDAGFDLIGSIPYFSHQDILLKRMIGAGKMGKVYQAWHHTLRREIAVKFLRKGLLHEPPLVQRFIGEAITIARLQHPNIVGTHGLGHTPSGAYFIVMELVTGSNLDLLARSNVISVEDAISWAMELCNALEHAHAQGIVHCDLKSANLLLDEHGRLRVTDFGLARSLTGQTAWAAEVEGTAPFMAPEQISRYWGPIGIRTDVYGIGAVLYTLLTGRPPWAGRRLPDILAKVVSAAPVIPPSSLRPDLPQTMSDLCRKCLSKAPEDRCHNVQEVRSVLAMLKGGTFESPRARGTR
jgi:tRNA A-37 threonylcarbamoyl transferase component Bud32